jgi:hypothetical protein
MNPQLRNDIIDRFKQGNPKLQITSQYIRRIECPACNHKEAFASADTPWVIKCGRENRCGAVTHVKEEYKELFESWTERYAPADDAQRKANPTAVADGYLRDGRGFDLVRIRGWYTQDSYYDHEIQQGTTTVRFALPNGFWERLLDKPWRFGKQKARIVGTYAGQAWVPPVLTMAELTEAREIWITEGIFNSIALHHIGHVSISNLSSGNYPDQFLAELAEACKAAGKKRPTLIWALDSDRAGRKFTLKHAARAKQAGWTCEAAQTGSSRDWNDLLQLEQLGDKNIEHYRYLGDLLLASTPAEKALLIYNKQERREFWFEFGGRTWWWKLDMDAYDREIRRDGADGAEHLTEKERESALKNAGVLTCICDATLTPLYFQANRVTDESWYYYRIETPDEAIHKHAFTPKQLTSSTEFKNRLLGIKGALWTGTGKQLDRLIQEHIRNLRTVETIDFIGYSKEHKAYVFTELAVREGKAVRINDEDFYSFGKLSLKTLANSPELHINTDTSDYRPEWARQVARAFGPAGVVTVAWWLGSLFAEQIRAHHKSYPFFELVGEAGAGKSTLIEFLWKTCGRADHEGFDPSKSSIAARGRSFAQVSNLPIVLIEADRESDKAKARQFDWDELKTAFNGRAIRSRGVKNSGNDTYEPPFRGSIMISQNAQVEASEAILSRICHITVTRAHQNADTKVAAEWLERIPTENVSGFLLQATRAEKQILEAFNEFAPHYEKQLLALDEIRMIRIAKCHAQLLALLDCLSDRVLGLLPEPIIEEARAFIAEMAKQRQAALNADHPLVTEFWEAFDFIENSRSDMEPRLNHAKQPNQIAVNLKEFERWCGEFKLRIPDMRQIKQLLRTSKARKFIDSNRSIRSNVGGHERTVKCWVFENTREKSHD